MTSPMHARIGTSSVLCAAALGAQAGGCGGAQRSAAPSAHLLGAWTATVRRAQSRRSLWSAPAGPERRRRTTTTGWWARWCAKPLTSGARSTRARSQRRCFELRQYAMQPGAVEAFIAARCSPHFRIASAIRRAAAWTTRERDRDVAVHTYGRTLRRSPRARKRASVRNAIRDGTVSRGHPAAVAAMHASLLVPLSL